ncbi:Ig-like domain-containing protein [[Eubacterium] cellulosolvens]
MNSINSSLPSKGKFIIILIILVLILDLFPLLPTVGSDSKSISNNRSGTPNDYTSIDWSPQVINGSLMYFIKDRTPYRWTYELLVDIDADDENELVFGVLEEDGNVTIYIYDVGTYQLEWQSPTTFKNAQIYINNTDQDAQKEIIIIEQNYISNDYNNYVYIYDGLTHQRQCKSSRINGTLSDFYVVDIDGDSQKEILLTVKFEGSSNNCTVHILSCQTLNSEWASNPIFTAKSYYYVKTFYNDIDSDNTLEIIVETSEWSSGFLTIINGGGTHNQEWRSQDSKWVFNNIMIDDVDNDGTKELLFSVGDTLYCFDGKSYTEEWNLTNIGPSIPNSNSFSFGFYIHDIDSDGGKEIIILTFATNDTDYSGYIYIYDGKNQTRDWKSNDLKAMVTLPQVMDIDDDNTNELIVNLFWDSNNNDTYKVLILDGKTHQQKWLSPLFNGYYKQPYIDDTDNDGILEILIDSEKSLQDPSPSGKIYIYNARNYQLEWESQDFGGTVFHWIGDIDYDGVNEILISTYRGAINSATAYIYSFNSKNHNHEWRSDNLGWYFSCKIGDLDKNNDTECLVIMWKYNESNYSNHTRKFLMFTFDRIHQPNIKQPISSLSMDEDTVDTTSIDLSQVFDDEDGDILTYRCEGEENVSVSIGSDGKVTLTPVQNWHGWDIISFLANDSIYEISIVVNITVNPINDPPVLNPIGSIAATEDEWYNFSVKAKDVDVEDSLSYSDNSSLFDIDPNNGWINFTPENKDVGIHYVNISVSDGNGGIDFENIEIKIMNINDDPIITKIGGVNVDTSTITFQIKEKEWFNISMEVEDIDLDIGADDVHTFKCNLTDGLGSDDLENFLINRDNGNISFLPNQNDVDNSPIYTNITVQDGNGGNDFVLIKLEVVNVNAPPPTSNIIYRTKKGNLTVIFMADEVVDEDGDQLEYNWAFGDGSLDKGIEVTHKYKKDGTYLVVLIVNDGNGGESQVTIDLTVTGPTGDNGNDEPDPKPNGTTNGNGNTTPIEPPGENGTTDKHDDKGDDGSGNDSRLWLIGALVAVAIIIVIILLLVAFLTVKKREKQKMGELFGTGGEILIPDPSNEQPPKQPQHIIPQDIITPTYPKPYTKPQPQFPQQRTISENNQPSPHDVCMTCGQPLYFKQEVNKYYCYHCQKFE